MDFRLLELLALDLGVLEFPRLGVRVPERLIRIVFSVVEPPGLGVAVLSLYGQCRVVPRFGSANNVRALMNDGRAAKRPSSTGTT